MERVLQAAGFQAWVFSSAEALLESAAISHAECFIFDIHLPGINGFELSRATGARKVPLIFVTAHDEPEMRQEAEACSAQFLVKPFTGRRLVEAVESALRGNHSS